MKKMRPTLSMNWVKYFFFIWVGCVWSLGAQARVFDFKSEHMATYFRGSYGPSQVGDGAFALSSGTTNTFDRKVQSNYSGEFGILFSLSRFNLRIGAELLSPREISDVVGTSAAGVEQFSLDTKILALIPHAALEFALLQSNTAKLLVGGGLGAASVSLDNTYKMTAAGTASSGLSDFTESSKGLTYMGQIYGAVEFLLSDNVTTVLDVGYRYFYLKKLTYTRDGSSYAGTQVKDNEVVNMDGARRSLDLGGYFVGLGFRFYLQL